MISQARLKTILEEILGQKRAQNVSLMGINSEVYARMLSTVPEIQALEENEEGIKEATKLCEAVVNTIINNPLSSFAPPKSKQDEQNNIYTLKEAKDVLAFSLEETIRMTSRQATLLQEISKNEILVNTILKNPKILYAKENPTRAFVNLTNGNTPAHLNAARSFLQTGFINRFFRPWHPSNHFSGDDLVQLAQNQPEVIDDILKKRSWPQVNYRQRLNGNNIIDIFFSASDKQKESILNDNDLVKKISDPEVLKNLTRDKLITLWETNNPTIQNAMLKASAVMLKEPAVVEKICSSGRNDIDDFLKNAMLTVNPNILPIIKAHYSREKIEELTTSVCDHIIKNQNKIPLERLGYYVLIFNNEKLRTTLSKNKSRSIVNAFGETGLEEPKQSKSDQPSISVQDDSIQTKFILSEKLADETLFDIALNDPAGIHFLFLAATKLEYTSIPKRIVDYAIRSNRLADLGKIFSTDIPNIQKEVFSRGLEFALQVFRQSDDETLKKIFINRSESRKEMMVDHILSTRISTLTKSDPELKKVVDSAKPPSASVPPPTITAPDLFKMFQSNSNNTDLLNNKIFRLSLDSFLKTLITFKEKHYDVPFILKLTTDTQITTYIDKIAKQYKKDLFTLTLDELKETIVNPKTDEDKKLGAEVGKLIEQAQALTLEALRSLNTQFNRLLADVFLDSNKEVAQEIYRSRDLGPRLETMAKQDAELSERLKAFSTTQSTTTVASTMERTLQQTVSHIPPHVQNEKPHEEGEGEGEGEKGKEGETPKDDNTSQTHTHGR